MILGERTWENLLGQLSPKTQLLDRISVCSASAVGPKLCQSFKLISLLTLATFYLYL